MGFTIGSGTSTSIFVRDPNSGIYLITPVPIATGSLLGSLFVKYAVGSNANLGANAPNYSFPIPVIFGIEVLASALLMAVIFLVVHTKGLKGFSGIAIGGIVGLDIFFFALISGASMNPARSLAPALLSGVVINLWLE